MTQLLSTALNYEQSYPCPLCRHGQLTNLVLMDAFSCSFCHHIFTANLPQQSICLADGQQAVSWQWKGQRWHPLHHPDIDFPLGIWILCTSLAVVPPALIWGVHHIFPPLPNSTGDSFHLLWLGVVFVTHSLIALLILAEFHQFPRYLSWKFRLQT
ncbi:hypothetical protein [Acaryochloris sp. IP29b_bin.148]|uniref:hypothetical protein n=1 Tax=Acaryochloris sp. IP29b_bin.148 TaxID=2969218 RepID=UPI00262B61DE|nr:hypothetical protein [Acaryochloris sp. IP29b_bin.148]